MKALVVYDSVFGNTEKVAQAIGEALASFGEAETHRVGDVGTAQLAGVQLLVVGSPTRAFSATPATKKFLAGIPRGGLDGVRVAAFDTRFPGEEAPSALLRFLVRVFGYAAEPMAARMEKKGGERAAAPAGFFVEGTEGPLREGELARAAEWAKEMGAA